MPDDFVELNPGSGGKKLDAESLTIAGQPVDRERVQLAGASALEVARISNAPFLSNVYGVATRDVIDSEPIAGLSFITVLTPLGSFATAWVDMKAVSWLDVHAQLAPASAVTASIDFTDAADPNTVPPGATDIVRTITTTLGGSALGGIDVPSFGIPGQMAWARIRLTDLTGGQTIKVRGFRVDVSPNPAQVPIVTALTKDFRAAITKSVVTGAQPSGAFVNQPASGVDTANSSTAPLGAAATFTGAFTLIEGFGGVQVNVVTDQSGTLLVDNSEDGTTVDRTSSFPVTGGTPFFIALTPLMKYIRIRYTNGATPQTSFRLQSIAKLTAPSPTLQRVDSSLVDASIVSNTRAVIFGKSPSGAYLPVPVNFVGYSTVVSQDFLRDVSLGRIAGHSIERVFGLNDTLSTALEDVWQNSGAHTYPAVAAAVSLVSTSANDAAAGTGVRSVRVTYLDAAFVQQEEVVNLAGIVPVVTVGTAIRVQRIVAETVGSGGVAAGTITATVATEQCRIAAGGNRSYDAFFTIPDGKTGLRVQSTLEVGLNDTCTFRFQVRATGANEPFKDQSSIKAAGTLFHADVFATNKIPSRADTRWQGISGGGSITAGVEMDLLIIDNALVA